MRFLVFVLMLTIAIVPRTVWAQYKVMLSDNYPPYNFINEKGELVGFNVDLLKAINEIYNSEIVISGDNWENINNDMETGKIQAIAGHHYPGDPNDNYIYTRSAINTSHCFLYNTNQSNNFSLELFRSLKEPLVGMWQNDVLIHYVLSINPTAKFVFVDNYKQLIETLDRKDVTCIFSQRVGSMYCAEKLGKDYIRPLEHRILERNMGFKVSKEYPELAEKLNNGLEIILDNGEYQRIYDKWITKYNNSHNDWHQYLKYILIFSSLTIALILLLLGLNWVLQLKVRSKTRDLQQQLELNAQIMQELEKQKIKAEESDKMKSAFLANMSHEIRTPMNGILGFSTLLKEPKLSGEQQQKYIGIIETSGARMLNIINDIIDISKIEAGLMKVDIAESNLNTQIEYIYSFFKPEVEAKGMKLTFKNTLTAKEAIIKTDREKVFAILTNLVKNAIKYSNQGSIEFGYNKKGDYIEFFVRDTGIGIPKDRQKAIFERFIQAEIEDKMARQGAGLGLAISKAYVEMLGGKIWVESQEGKGSTFYFTIPYNEPFKKEIDFEKFDVGDGSLNLKLKILIAEDDETSRQFLTIIADKYGEEIINVINGTETVEVCRNNADIDLILLDIQMPDLNGYEATRQIREFNKDVIIIAQTAYGLSDDREKALDAGCNDYISKPIDKNEFDALIQKYFNK